jgi:hypothetical protein
MASIFNGVPMYSSVSDRMGGKVILGEEWKTAIREFIIQEIEEELEFKLTYKILKEQSLLITNLKHDNENIRNFCMKELGIKKNE